MVYNYFVLTLIPCQIWLKFCSILCTLYFMWDFIVWIVCERECEDSRQHWRLKEFSQVTREKTSCKVSHVHNTWLECKKSWQLVFTSISRVRHSREILAKHFVLLFWHIWSTMSSLTLYIPSLPTNWDECLSKRKP